MKKLYKAITCAVLAFFCLIISANTNAQSFRKGSFLISISEGSTYAAYTTTGSAQNSDVMNTGHIAGDRDPITVEYGITKKWGIGLNMGGDIYNIDPSRFYNFSTTTNKVKVITSELTLDANYHFFVTRHTDIAACLSFGGSSVSFKGNDGDFHYQYNSGGNIVRIGTKARYYFRKRFGVHAMLSAFTTKNATNGIKGNTVANNYTTGLSGYAIEFGLCYRILR